MIDPNNVWSMMQNGLFSSARWLPERQETPDRLLFAAVLHDDQTAKHAQRVGHAAASVARRLGRPVPFAALLSEAAPLHDIGKLGIADSIRLKPGRLTAEEFETIKTHTTLGAELLSKSSSKILQLAEKIASTHHERWDGNGYPHGLAGDEIPIGGRIVAVVDSFDAMTHERPYRSAISIADARAEIERCSGSQFDPAVVDALLASAPDDELALWRSRTPHFLPRSGTANRRPNSAPPALFRRSRPGAPRPDADLEARVAGPRRNRSELSIPELEEALTQAAIDRKEAAIDREQAAIDREEAAIDRKDALAHLDRAHTDELTGAYRRGAGEAALQQEVDRALRTGESLVLAFVDVDGLKATNDRLGHAAGDARLRAAVAAIRSKTRSYEPIVRFGGDEFVCSYAGIGLERAGTRFAEIAALLAADAHPGSVSVGFAELESGETLAGLIARADAAMLESRVGRARAG